MLLISTIYLYLFRFMHCDRMSLGCDRTKDEDWYWGINIKVLVNPKKGWQSKNFGVKHSKLPLVRAAQREGKDYVYIVEKVLGKSIDL
ncbi:hypothetical protein BJP36_20025 [Moorena producens JHB]|uniref:Uncharacterized protein n=1 Tax=Moorena producens (strain JHB) TaxID=1454205 RepID=A0A1D9G2U2_MOOP1|nr:hypothetical protein [Moorena producens]AOY81854.1 hypothetical protein BJP36_20025 [Moorena producens JHB]